MPNNFSLKEAAIVLEHKASPDGLYFEDVISTLGSKSQVACVVFFSLPFIQPVPLLGLSTPIGILVMSFGLLIILDKPFWLPQKMLRKHLSEKIVVSSCRVLIRILNKTERIIKPRFTGWTSSRMAQILNGFLIIIFAFLLSLPLPIPFSNLVPAWFLLTNALGELEEDGLLMFLSYCIAFFGFFFFFGLGLGFQESLLWIKSQIL